MLLNHGDNLASIDYTSSSNHLLHESIYIGDDTTALLLQVQDEGQETVPFYRELPSTQLLKVNNFRSPLWLIFAGLYPHQGRNVTVGLFYEIEKCQYCSINHK